MAECEKDEQKAKNAVCFIKATQELIDTEGLDKLSIRKIAEKAGFHNSTIYLYFKDLQHLILLASLKHFAEYNHTLAEYSRQQRSPEESFFAIWEAFGKTVLQNPPIFYNFFFGKYSQNLTPIIRQYYELFPEEKEEYSKEIESMYYGNSIQERCLQILAPLADHPTVRVTSDNMELVNSIIVSCLKDLLQQKCENPALDSQQLNANFLSMLSYIIGYQGEIPSFFHAN
ncbi:TetR/AcrR family transcriptional regulator [uncultured Negativibacillus sp.]|uniref:TetR/AcrR family transcriptional regulator n=1 Tax=uncultured Negativibacillus sp. TaxID=1980696 RepID=UPI0025FEA54C|nr:TetR/AcrR family transcriptional regulator [uncultured Negativibacillus sp.]